MHVHIIYATRTEYTHIPLQLKQDGPLDHSLGVEVTPLARVYKRGASHTISSFQYAFPLYVLALYELPLLRLSGNRQTDRQTDKQTDRQIDRQTDRQTNRQTDK